MLLFDRAKVRGSNHRAKFPMQQQYPEVKLPPPETSVRVASPNQWTIEIEQTPAYHRRQSRGAAEPSSQVAPHSSQAMPAVLTNVIGAHRMSQQDPLTDYHFETDLLSTGNFELVNVQWQGAFTALLNQCMIWRSGRQILIKIGANL